MQGEVTFIQHFVFSQVSDESEEGESEYYDEEEEGAEQPEEENEEEAIPAGDAAAPEEESKDEQSKPEGDEAAEDIDDEYDSDYDEEGNYIWGAENADWTFYYTEDQEAYERGETTVPETLNSDALPR